MTTLFQGTIKVIVTISFLFLIACRELPDKENNHFEFSNGDNYLQINLLDDDLVNFQYGTGSPDGKVMQHTVMVYKDDYSGPSAVKQNDNRIETKDLQLSVDEQTLAVTIIDKTKGNAKLTTIYPFGENQKVRGIKASCTGDLIVCGLGQQFKDSLITQVSYNGKIREGSEFGNKMMRWKGGFDANTQIPVMYAVEGTGFNNYGLFFDNIYRHRWDFTDDDSWYVETTGGEVNFYFMSGPDLPDLRRDYMELTGNPLIPPKKMFGWWLSEYGFENWGEVESKIDALRKNRFPVDGFVMDLQWYGGIARGNSQIGSYSWDLDNFPDPELKFKEYWEEGLGVMMMTETYVDAKIPEFQEFADRGYLAYDSSGITPAVIPPRWWGHGGYIDFTNPEACTYLFDEKIKPLLDIGLFCHWMDLGEPEDFDPEGVYYNNMKHADIHNLYNFLWVKSYFDGYSRNGISLRPFYTTRSGTAGIQRLGAALWSGDIGTYMMSLAAHARNQSNMSFSGIDYYRSDIGGYWRHLTDKGYTYDELYTKWYAYSMLFEIPARPHCENPVNEYETSPAGSGHLQSNLSNTRMRYAWIPYLYSCAYQSYSKGDPLIPPLVYYFQDDPQVYEISDQKMIGNFLMGCADFNYGAKSRSVYLPEGSWYDWYTNQKITSTGEFMEDVPLFRKDLYKLPVYAIEGAIIPMQYIDDQSMNATGQRLDGSMHEELIVKIYPSAEGSKFILYEDDNQTVAYLDGAIRLTSITQEMSGDEIIIRVGAAMGLFDINDARQNILRVVCDKPVESVSLNGNTYEEIGLIGLSDPADNSGWFISDQDELIIVTGTMGLQEEKVIRIICRQ